MWIVTTPYTITFDSNGGSPVESITLGYGSTITPPANPTREGYSFQGWEPELPTVMPQNNMTVTAKWAINSYTLTYVVDGEVYKTSSVTYGTTIMPEAAPTKEGYTFSGWSEIPATMPAGDVTVAGSFSVNSYKLTYVVDGEVYKTSSVAYGTAITPEAEPTKPSYTFSGWSEIPATMPAHDVTVTGTFTYISDTGVSDLDNVVYIDNVEGFVGQQLTLSVKMKNTVGIQTVQFDLCLPEGVTVAKDEDGFDLIELSTERTTAKKMDSFSSSQVSDGSYRVLINSNRGYTFDGEDGEIALVTVTIDPEMQEGDYPIYLRDIVLVNTSSEGYETEYVKSTLTVSAYSPGDVNGDGKVNAIDLNAIVNYILEHRNFPFTFVEKAADLNADGKVNAIDVNALTNMILRGDAPQSVKKQTPIMVGTLEER
ncbi:MAG: InlB B-repeat-containing protein [Bacteroidaceae bacterium]|nr:InlB B-repeat-containing protein [Bacteroidaceae bacterium]